MLIIKKTAKAIKGFINPPASKSVAQRYLIAAFFSALNNKKTVIYNYSDSTDFLNLLDNFKALGLIFIKTKTSIKVKSFKRTKIKILNTKDSAFNLRVLAVILKLFNEKFIIKHSINNRIKDDINLKPYIKKNTLLIDNDKRIKKTIDTSISSQTASAYFFLLAFLYNKSKLKIKNLKSYEFLKLSKYVLNKFNIKVIKNNNIFTIVSNPYNGGSFTVLNDMSLVCFYVLIALRYNDIKIKNINKIQGEYEFIKLLKSIGAKFKINKNSLIFKKTSNLKAFSIDISQNPDLITPLLVLASMCSGKSTIKGVARLVYKEEDRKTVILKYLKQLGIKTSCTKNTISVYGKGFNYDFTDNKIFKIESKDHRIIMSLVALLINKKIIFIKNSQCVSKSNKEFFKSLKSLGFKL